MEIRLKIIKLIEYAYKRFFNLEMSPQVHTFIKNLSWVFFGIVIAKFLLLVIHVAAGRFLGAELYGEFELILSIMAFLTIPIMIGLPALVKFTAEEKSIERKKKIISTFTWFMLFSLILFITVFYFFSEQLSSVFRIGPKLFLGAVFLAVPFSLMSYSESVLAALSYFKRLSIITIISHTIAFIVFMIMLFQQKTIYLIFIPFALNYFSFGIISIFYLARYIEFKFDIDIFHNLLSYGFYGSLILIASTFMARMDSLMINFFIGAENVGIYRAYYTASIVSFGILMGIFTKVFFPTASSFEDKRSILQRLDKLILPAIIFICLVMPVFVVLIIYLYGFVIDKWLVALFTIAVVFDALTVVYSTLLNSIGIESIKRTCLSVTIVFMLNILLNFFLIQLIGIYGAIISTILSTSMLFLFIRHYVKKFVYIYPA